MVPLLGVAQIIAWGSSFYLLAVLAAPIRAETGWPLGWIVGGLSAALAVAGVGSPVVGRIVQRRGGRPVLVASALLFAVGLSSLALSRGLPLYFASWLVIGAGMSAGLYEAAFGTLGRLYGRYARGAIGALTLVAGFSSTITWPLSSVLAAELGWRGACLAWAAIHAGVLLPVYAALIPRPPAAPPAPGPVDQALAPAPAPGDAVDRSTFALLTIATTLAALIATVLAVHVLTILQAGGVPAASAVAWAAILGPAQVGARALEMVVGRRHHPIGSKLAAAALIAGGVGLLAIELRPLAPALVLFGAGVGIESIARGTLPLALFGERGFAVAMGRIALPSLIVQAAAPTIGAGLIATLGARGALIALSGLAAANVVVVACLWRRLPRAGGRSRP